MNFLRIKQDVSDLITNYEFFNWMQTDEEPPNHLVRSAILMLCASWERYNEDLLLESIEYVCQNATDVSQLDTKVKKYLSKKVKESKTETKPIELAGEGWKRVWLELARNETQILNTPNTNNLKELFDRFLGITDISRLWIELVDQIPEKKDFINSMVRNRGDIAHNGNLATSVNIESLRKYVDEITDIAVSMDSKMASEIGSRFSVPPMPYQKTYYRELKSYLTL